MDSIGIDRLFRSSKAVEYMGRQLVVRALSDFEMQLRYRAALEASARMGRQLRDTDSGAYLSLIGPLDESDDETLQSTIAFLRTREFADAARKAHPFQYKPFPDDATDAEKEQVLAAREKFDADLATARSAFVTKKLKALKSDLTPRDGAWLLAEATKLSIQMAKDSAYSEEIVWQTVLLGVETIDGQPFFANVADVRKLGRQATDFLWQEVEAVNSIDPLGLKSPSSTD